MENTEHKNHNTLTLKKNASAEFDSEQELKDFITESNLMQ